MGLTEEVFKRFPAMLRGGEQQRIAIARAIVTQPKVIQADEPTGNLDTENSENIVRLLKDLACERNCCVIIVTHDPAVRPRRCGAAHAGRRGVPGGKGLVSSVIVGGKPRGRSGLSLFLPALRGS